jgi:hypothetical protein
MISIQCIPTTIIWENKKQIIFYFRFRFRFYLVLTFETDKMRS